MIRQPLEREIAALRSALREIANRAGKPTMDYCPEVALREQRDSLDWIAGKAAEALKISGENNAN